jgi:hypothetical protein
MNYNDEGDIVINGDDQCYTCKKRLQSKCLVMNLLCHKLMFFDPKAGITVNQCFDYEPSNLRVV